MNAPPPVVWKNRYTGIQLSPMGISRSKIIFRILYFMNRLQKLYMPDHDNLIPQVQLESFFSIKSEPNNSVSASMCIKLSSN